jgi:hypothetical protein
MAAAKYRDILPSGSQSLFTCYPIQNRAGSAHSAPSSMRLNPLACVLFCWQLQQAGGRD